MRILSARAHAVLDYVMVGAFALGPVLLGFSDGARVLSWVLASAHMVISLITAYPISVVKNLSFPTHGLIELFVAIVLILLGGFFFVAQEERLFFIAVGAVIIVVRLLTRYEAAV